MRLEISILKVCHLYGNYSNGFLGAPVLVPPAVYGYTTIFCI